MKNSHSSKVRRCLAAFICLLVGLAILGPVPAAAQLNMWFSNASSYSSSDIWITVQRGQGATLAQGGIAAGGIVSQDYTPVINYWNGSSSTSLNWRWLTNSTNPTISPWQPGSAGSIYSESVQLSYILTNGNGLLTWMSNAISAAVIVSYGSTPFSPYTPTQTTVPTSNNYTTGAASSSASPDPNYGTAWQPFEITYGGLNGAPQPGDQGNLTAINFFTAALRIQSFANTDATGPVLQERGFFVPTSQIAAGLSSVTSGPAVNGQTAYVTNSNGDIVRYIGPSQFGASQDGSSGYGNYPSFDSYFAGAGSSNAQFTNNSGYNTMSGTPSGNYTNKIVSFAFENSVTDTGTGYALNPTGTITVVTRVYTNSVIDGAASTSTYSNIVFNVNPTAQSPGDQATVITNIASQFVYLASWTSFNQWTNSNGSTNIYSWFEGSDWNSFTSDMTGFVDGANSNAMADITAQIAGEIASGFQAGFVGSTNPAIAGQPSDSWWSNGIVNAFGGSQPTNVNYVAYGGIIADTSSNSVYGLQYSDRFPGQSPLMNSYQLNGTNIGSWLITIEDPITAVPEPSTYALLAMAGAGAAGYMLRRRRR